MIKTKSGKIILVLIFFLTLFLRTFKLNEFPTGLNADEAAIGYNAYSLIQTGKDEFGHAWPVNFQSFNDFKPGLYFYLVLPFVKALGLNEWAVRLPSALMGTLTVVVLYFLLKEFFSKEAALVSALLLSLSPWHLHFSRGGWETNAATFFIVLGIWLFVKAFKKPGFFVLSVLCFGLSMLAYHSARVVAPLLGLGLVFMNFSQVFAKKNFKWLLASFFVGIVFLILLASSFLGEAGASRFSGVGIFADQGPLWRVNELRGQHPDPFSTFSKLAHNKFVEYSFRFVDNWLRHFSGNFLFISGDEIQRNRVPEMGQFLLIELPFLVFGFYFLLRNKPKFWLFFLGWVAVAPIASALTFQSPHAIRALNMVIPLIVLAGYGITQSFLWLKSKTKLYGALSIMYLVFFVWNFSFYLHQYYVHYHKTYPAAWEDGFRELAGYVSGRKDDFERIYITNKYDQPYILMAFYLKYPPEKFQEQAVLTPRDQFGFSTVDRFDKFYFGPIDYESLSGQENIMIIGSSGEIPDSATIAKRIYFRDGKTEAFRIVEY
ncbi:phospholipid carrier-dependent glycosyltransferase [Candidatus Microgenomates bacterium]|jgi:4-amino-4-deoxy-L-arabinose transferase-like glycosyltransferase|nr:MAG: phospholipid carrier-dependent glycosyltransferase [Candidatus Microgenomates bacterium]